jgi:hypothetical protein
MAKTIGVACRAVPPLAPGEEPGEPEDPEAEEPEGVEPDGVLPPPVEEPELSGSSM